MDGGARRIILWGALAAAALLAVAGTATAAPQIVSPGDGEAVGTLRPLFRWQDPAPAPATARYEVHMSAPTGTPPLATVPATGPGSYAATANRDLPLDGTTRWFVRAVSATGATIFQTPPVEVRTSPAPAVAGPSGLINQSRPVFSWALQSPRVSSTWRVVGTTSLPEVTLPAGEPQVAAPGPLPDGVYELHVRQRVGAAGESGWDSGTAVVPFTVDATPPGLLAITSAPPFPTTDATPSFSWAGAEPGARQTWRVIGAGGGVVQGPGDGAAGAVTVGPLAPGSYAFEVRQQDVAGNLGDWRSQPFAVVVPPPAPPPRATTTRLRLPRRNAKALKPRVGARIRSLRPTLRWRAHRRAKIYNVQLFVVGKQNRLRKVHSAFPRRTHFKVPRRKLGRGRCYVWRVWPFIGRRFTKTPLGVSNFCVVATRRR